MKAFVIDILYVSVCARVKVVQLCYDINWKKLKHNTFILDINSLSGIYPLYFVNAFDVKNVSESNETCAANM